MNFAGYRGVNQEILGQVCLSRSGMTVLYSATVLIQISTVGISNATVGFPLCITPTSR
jgi:hypothetical protein